MDGLFETIAGRVAILAGRPPVFILALGTENATQDDLVQVRHRIEQQCGRGSSQHDSVERLLGRL